MSADGDGTTCRRRKGKTGPEQNRPDEHASFQQQHMSSWQPVISPGCAIPCFLLAGAIMIVLGAWMFAVQSKLRSLGPIRYDDTPACGAALEASPCVVNQRGSAYGSEWLELPQRPLNPLCVPLHFDEDPTPATEGKGSNVCNKMFEVEEAMDGPVYFYFRISNFYQNHRVYVADRADNQLIGLAAEESTRLTFENLATQLGQQGCKGTMRSSLSCTDTQDGGPWLPLHDTENINQCQTEQDAIRNGLRWCACVDGKWSIDATSVPCSGLNQSDYDSAHLRVPTPGAKCPSNKDASYKDDGYHAVTENQGQCWAQWCNPCGRMARSFFTDKFKLLHHEQGNVNQKVSEVKWEKGGTYPRDAEKFGEAATQATWNTDTNKPQLNVRTANQNQLVTSPEFSSWMRASILPRVKKLYRVLPEGLKAGKYTLQIRNNYDPQIFGNGTKEFVFTTTHPVLGSNVNMLGTICCAVGGMCFLTGLAMLCKTCSHRTSGAASTRRP